MAMLLSTIAPCFSPAATDPQAALEQLETLGLDLQSDAFAVAVARKQGAVVDLLLQAGVNPNRPDRDGRTALHHAIILGDEKLVARLLGAKADARIGDARGVTPLMLAAARNAPKLLDALLKAGSEAGATDQSGATALHYAINAKQLGSFQRLLKESPRTDAVRCDGRDALALAVETRDWAFIQPLFGQAAVREWDSAGRTLLQQAIEAKNVEQMRMLLSRHHGPPTPEGCKDPLLIYAVAANDVSLTRLLLEAGADPNTALETPAESSLTSGYSLPKFLQRYMTEETGVTPLMIAAGLGNNAMVTLLMEKGADRYKATRSKYRLLPLYFAAWGDHADCLQTLIGNAPPPDKYRIEVQLSSQRATVFRDGSPVYNTAVSSGRKGYATPTGRFVVTDKAADHVSTIYKAKMPFFMRLSCRDFGLHQGVVPNYPASHGCIRLPEEAARKLFKEVPLGTMVTITN